MDGHRLASVFTGLRLGLHAVVALIVLIVLWRSLPPVDERAAWGVAAVIAWSLAYAAGVLDGARRTRARLATAGAAAGAADPTSPAGPTSPTGAGRRPAAVWLGIGALSVLWFIAAWCLPEAAYLVFPLFFLQLHLLGARWGTALVLLSALGAVITLGLQQGFSVPGAVGPLLGAAVALLVGLGFRAFTRQAQARESLLAELVATRDELVRSERRAGEEAERARLARDIHDTVSQSLSSIQMLLHAAERAPEGEQTTELLRLARDSAASAQAETRAIVRALAPAPLQEEGLAAALRRLAGTEWAGGPGVLIEVHGDERLDMSRRTALLRLAQGAVGNALRHARAGRVEVLLTVDDAAARLRVSDDGVGFAPELAPGAGHGAGHFGLASMRERVAQLGGSLEVDSAPGNGTRVVVVLPLAPTREG
ncbi:MAG: sensor histidine kinase [Arthrobacter sp.]|jgi:signal transduction histidine kinase|nr:sensor histidine kinase [Arthrobacter sp.]